MQSATKHMAKKMAVRIGYVATVENDINAPIGRKEDVIKISAKNCKVNKAVIENVGNCFTKLKVQIKAVLLRCCLSFIIV